jgi:hypothetical protein
MDNILGNLQEALGSDLVVKGCELGDLQHRQKRTTPASNGALG